MEELIINKNYTWRDLLDDYVKKHYSDTKIEEQDKQSIEEFIDLVKHDDTNNEIPKFFFKKPMNYNDLNFSVKTEAKSRFLSMKSFEIPSKKRKLLYLI